ncbi:TPA: YbhB/YbcL family Raf kinase inhibitor-like protein [Candidatus Woesearchaeota archaeon]|nr:YbhB/YbcL family Raf kinase inhibitor-like protein [Candidatus Woesearchaeota archaeon]
MITFRITSTSFSDGGAIPAKHTCQGENTKEPLRFDGVPKGTVSMALVMDDPDAPVGVWDHWLLWNIDAQTRDIKEHSVPSNAVQGKNGWGMSRYGGPCPPSGTHRYTFTAYALDKTVDLAEGSTKRDLERAMEGRIIGKTVLVGTYRKE